MSLSATVLVAITLWLGSQAPQPDRPVRAFSTRGVVYFVAFSQDGKSLTAWSAEGFTRWDALSGKAIERQPVIFKACGRRTAVLPRAEDARTVTANCGSKLLFFDIVSGESRGERAVDPKQPPAIYAASPDGALFANVAAGALTEVRVSELKTADVKTTIKNEQEVQQVTFAPSGGRLATGAVDGVRLWQLPEGRLLHTIPNGTFHAFSPDGALIAVERGRDVAIVDAATGASKVELAAPASQLRFSPDGRLLAGWTNQQLTVWDVTSAKPVVNLRGDQLVGAAISPDGSLLAVVGMQLAGDTATSTIAVWRLRQ